MPSYHSPLSNQQQGCTCGAGCFGGGKVRRDQNDVTDSFQARELNELSVNERERVYEDVHGIAPIPEETPELIQDAFADLNAALAKTPRRQRRAYDRAIFLKPNLDKDRTFQLMFLRADQYDGVKAARRMCNYFTNKLELFGHEKLVKKITLDDFNEDDMASVNTGSVHILPRKDSAGRAVWFFALRYYKYMHRQNQIRYIWYTLMAGLEDEDVQLNGVVVVQYCVDMVSVDQRFAQMITKAGSLLLDLPFRNPGLHCCYNDVRLRPLLSMMQVIVGKQARLRFRTHYGSNLEAQKALTTFGIPMGFTLIRSDGSLNMEITERYLADRRYKDAEWQKEEERCSTILYPSRKDVLLGRGRPYQEFGGNQALAHIIELRRAQYQQATDRFDKTCLTLDAVKTIQERGGRFLKRLPEEGWEEVDDAAAREKVSQSFRTKSAREIKPADIPSNEAFSISNKRVRYDEDFLKHHDNDADISTQDMPDFFR